MTRCHQVSTGGDGLGERWEEPGMYIEAPEGSGVEWFFLDVGSKQSTQPPMLLLHGIPAFSYMWRNVLPDLVGAGRRAIVVDFPGFGNSSMIQVRVGLDEDWRLLFLYTCSWKLYRRTWCMSQRRSLAYDFSILVMM